MRFLIADTFMKSLDRLAREEQGLVKQAAFEFQTNPANPGARFHKLDRARDARFWSFRVNQDLRMIVHRDGAESLMLCYAGHHDHAYQWAERRQLEVHPKTGAAQFVEVQERVEEVVRQVVREVARVEEPPLFAKYEKDYLLGLGVPPRWVDALRAVGESAFLELAAELPQEAAERLMQLATGTPVPLPVSPDSADPFEHPDAQRRFRQLENQDELAAALNAPWERWTVFLHPTQRRLVQTEVGGPARVSGGAGTGKSVVALHRAAHLARRSGDARVLLTTFSKALAARLEHHLNTLMGEDPARDRITVRHLHAVASRIALGETGHAGDGDEFVPVSNEDLDLCIAQALRGRNNDWLNESFVRSEWSHIVDAYGITTWADYQAVSRKGRGVPLSAKKRQLVWAVMEAALAGLHRRGMSTFNMLCVSAAQKLKDGPLYQHVVADECQDFGPAELRLIRALCESGPNDLFFCGDEGQRIYQLRVSWASLGIDVRGRSTRLTLNYRTTAQIRRLADQLLPGEVTDGDGNRERHDTVSLFSGPTPELAGFGSPAEEQAALQRWLVARRDDGLALHEIAVFARTSKLLDERVVQAVRGAGLAVQHLRQDGVPAHDRVVLATLHGAKGLEFRAVAIAGCDRGQLPLSAVARRLNDEADREDFAEHERHLLYVACTRARERLLVTWSGEGCAWLPAASK